MHFAFFTVFFLVPSRGAPRLVVGQCSPLLSPLRGSEEEGALPGGDPRGSLATNREETNSVGIRVGCRKMVQSAVRREETQQRGARRVGVEEPEELVRMCGVTDVRKHSRKEPGELVWKSQGSWCGCAG